MTEQQDMGIISSEEDCVQLITSFVRNHSISSIHMALNPTQIVYYYYFYYNSELQRSLLTTQETSHAGKVTRCLSVRCSFEAE